MKKVFISHSSKDKKYAEYMVDLVESMGVPSGNIFCSSVEGYGIPPGVNFLEIIKNELSEDTVVLFIITSAFYASPVCLCEMGAAWVITAVHIPILVPPFDYSDLKGVISSTQGLKINDKSKLNSLCSTIRLHFGINEPDINIWERKRDKFLNLISREINYFSKAAMCCGEGVGGIYDSSPYGRQPDVMDRFYELLKEVREKLNRLPWIVRKGLYYHFSGRDFILDSLKDEDEVFYAEKAGEDDFLTIDGKWVTLNVIDPKVRKAIDALDQLKFFMESTGKEFHDTFEERYEICAKIE